MLGINNIQLSGNKVPIGLTQIKDLVMPAEFSDSAGNKWRMAKSSKDSSVEIPDPAMVSVTRWWNHVHPASDGKVYIYVVEGIKRPRTETESAVMVLYQWFSTTNRPNFVPAEITAVEWYSANVYTADIIDSRTSILNSLCGYVSSPKTDEKSQKIEELDSSLIGRKDDRTTETSSGRTDRPYKK